MDAHYTPQEDKKHRRLEINLFLHVFLLPRAQVQKKKWKFIRFRNLFIGGVQKYNYYTHWMPIYTPQEDRIHRLLEINSFLQVFLLPRAKV